MPFTYDIRGRRFYTLDPITRERLWAFVDAAAPENAAARLGGVTGCPASLSIEAGHYAECVLPAGHFTTAGSTLTCIFEEVPKCG